MHRPWTEDEIKLVREMRAAGHFYEEIDWALRWRGDTTKRQQECQTTRGLDETLLSPRATSAL